MDCPHSSADTKGDKPADQQQGASKSLAQSCCPSAPFGWAVIAVVIYALARMALSPVVAPVAAVVVN